MNTCHAIAEPVREALAAHVAAQYASHGPDVWAAPQPHLRRSHQEAVQALARLGDVRAVPSLLKALDSGDDAWRAVQVAGALPQATVQLVPRLRDHLRSLDLTQQLWEMGVRSTLSALAALADDRAVDVVSETLASAMRHEVWSIVCSALKASAAFGPSAAPALPAVRSLLTSSDIHVRPAAVAALWAITGDPDEVMQTLLDLLDDSITFRITDAADVLADIGPRAQAHCLACGSCWPPGPNGSESTARPPSGQSKATPRRRPCWTPSSKPGSRTLRPPTMSSHVWTAWVPPHAPPCHNSTPNCTTPSDAAGTTALTRTKNYSRSAALSSNG